jgi:hypothetical protein
MKARSGPAGDPFPDKLPVGIDANGHALFLYLVLPIARDDFRAFLGRHAELLRALPAWTLRLVFPRSLAHAYGGFQAVVREELESPLAPRTVEELTWYFGQLRAMPNARTRPPGERFERAAEAFERPRFYRLYRHWLKEGDSALDGAFSTVISDALASGAGQVESVILPHRYDHLSPLVDLAGSGSNGVDKADEERGVHGVSASSACRAGMSF